MMWQKLILAIAGLIFGVGLGYWLVMDDPGQAISRINQTIAAPRKQVIGFMPFWLIGKTETDFSQYLTTLSYFSLNVSGDGSIQKLSAPTETEPGWFTLKSGKADELLNQAKQQKLTLSLVIFAGKPELISDLISDPENHANNLIADLAPVMRQHGFSDLNLDIEDVSVASPAAQLKFTQFVKQVKQQLDQQKLGTLTIEVSPSDLIHPRLTNSAEISKIADYVVLMAYDYHYIGSSVTGPVSPIGGVGEIAEYDIESAVKLAKQTIPNSKLILGIPLYGYEWETLGDFPRAAVIPGTGLIASNARVEELLANCSDCQLQTDSVAEESYLISFDPQTQTFHQYFFPTQTETESKLKYVQNHQLDGVALWALGYEGKTVMSPLKNYLGR